MMKQLAAHTSVLEPSRHDVRGGNRVQAGHLVVVNNGSGAA